MRDIETLHPILKLKALELKQRCQDELGIRIVITECLRTRAEQVALYAQGRKTLAEVNSLRAAAKWSAITVEANMHRVTNASSIEDSFHGYGLAFDIAITDASGKHIDWSNKSDWNEDHLNDWHQVGELGVELGLEWGGQWTSFPDIPHYQFTFGLTIRTLKCDDTICAGQTIVLSDELITNYA